MGLSFLREEEGPNKEVFFFFYVLPDSQILLDCLPQFSFLWNFFRWFSRSSVSLIDLGISPYFRRKKKEAIILLCSIFKFIDFVIFNLGISTQILYISSSFLWECSFNQFLNPHIIIFNLQNPPFLASFIILSGICSLLGKKNNGLRHFKAK